MSKMLAAGFIGRADINKIGLFFFAVLCLYFAQQKQVGDA